MNKDQEKATMTQQAETAEMGCLAKTRAFLEIPNPEIVKVLVISSSATFTSGIALAFEWLFHGRSHTGFGWIVYYALFLICLPLLVLIGLRILMATISCPSHGSSSQAVDSVAATAKEECVEASQQTERNSCRSLAVVVDSDETKKNRDEKMPPPIKRAVSLPSHGNVRSCRTR